MHGHRHADPGVRARELLEHEDVGEEVGAGAAELLGHADAHQPELGELSVELDREAVLAVPGGGVRLDLRLRELTRERLDLPLLGGEGEVHRRASLRGDEELAANLVEHVLAVAEGVDDVRVELLAALARGSRGAPRASSARPGTGGGS